MKETKHEEIPSQDGLYWYVTESKEPEPVLIQIEKYGEGTFKGFNGRRQSWLKKNEYLFGPIAPNIK